jgi:hypothetical protein
MTYLSDEHPDVTLALSKEIFIDLSEQEQESISGGLFMYYNQIQVNSMADHATNFSGTFGAGSDNSGGGAGFMGTFNNSGSANYQLTISLRKQPLS